jgi:hypothetical protein
VHRVHGLNQGSIISEGGQMLSDGLLSLLVDKNSQALFSANESTHKVIISVMDDFHSIDLFQII